MSVAALCGGSGCLVDRSSTVETRTEAIEPNDPRSPDDRESAGGSVASRTYELSNPGQVSAAVYDSEGRLLRTLMRGVHREAGQHTVEWDGLDRHGTPHDGDATIKILRTSGLRAEYITSIGTTPRSADHHWWPGQHHGPACAAIDDTGIYVGGGLDESTYPLVKEARDGDDQLWRDFGRSIKGPWAGCESLALDGEGTLYLLQTNGYMTPFDARTGESYTPSPTRGWRSRETWDPLPDGVERSNQLYSSHTEEAVTVREPPHAAREGSGLDGAYYVSTTLDGAPTATRTDDRIWAGQSRSKVDRWVQDRSDRRLVVGAGAAGRGHELCGSVDWGGGGTAD